MNLDNRTQSQADNDWAQIVPDAELVSQAFEAARVSDHTDPAVQLTLARHFHAKGRYREAMDMLESLMQRYPDAPDLLEEAGQLAEQFGEDEQADRYLRCAASRGGTLALVGLATAQMHAGRVAPAAWLWWRIARLADVERAAAIEAWAALAVCANEANRLRVIKYAQRQLSDLAVGDDARQAMARAEQHLSSGRVISASRVGRGQRTQNPSSLQWIAERAADTLEEHARVFPGRADTHYHLAMCEHVLGNRDAATANVAQALNLNPNYRAAKALQLRIEPSDDAPHDAA